MRNTGVIEEIMANANPILEKLNNREIVQFQVKELDLNNGISLRGIPLVGKAIGRIFYTLKVRPNFNDFASKMTTSDFNLISQKLKSAEAETKMYAKIVKNDKGNPEIVECYYHNDKKTQSDASGINNYFDWMVDSLQNSEKEYSLKDFRFNSRKETFDLILLDETQENKIDAFGTGLDLWKMGDRFEFNSLKFDYAPFLERLSCSNGNTALEYGFGADISHAKFNDRRLESVIQKALSVKNETVPLILQQSVSHLQQNNVSMAEFYHYRKFFENLNDDGIYTGLINNYFDDKPFYQSYGVDINGKSNKWKSTANTGINAYDFFNMITYIASHPKEVRMDRDHRTQLQINASNLLFKKELDLEDIATSVKIDYPRLAAMN